jgi:hypothetical protein
MVERRSIEGGSIIDWMEPCRPRIIGRRSIEGWSTSTSEGGSTGTEGEGSIDWIERCPRVGRLRRIDIEGRKVRIMAVMIVMMVVIMVILMPVLVVIIDCDSCRCIWILRSCRKIDGRDVIIIIPDAGIRLPIGMRDLLLRRLKIRHFSVRWSTILP